MATKPKKTATKTAVAKPKKTAQKPKATTKRTINSNSTKAKNIVRAEIRNYYKPHEYGVRSTVDAVKKDADAYNNNRSAKVRQTNYQKGAGLVDAGCFACYHSQQRVMLGKIYGKKKVETWDGEKVHNTYKHLIGREYESMLNEKRKKK